MIKQLKQSRLGFSFALVLLSAPWTVTACRDASKTDPSADASPADAAVLGTSAQAAFVPTTVRPPDEAEHDGGDLHDEDAGRDGGTRKRRRLVGPGLDASVETTAPVAPPPAPTGEATAERPRGKGTSGMVDDQPFGGAGASSAPTLKKKPLPVDDPWVKPPAPDPPR